MAWIYWCFSQWMSAAASYHRSSFVPHTWVSWGFLSLVLLCPVVDLRREVNQNIKRKRKRDKSGNSTKRGSSWQTLTYSTLLQSILLSLRFGKLLNNLFFFFKAGIIKQYFLEAQKWQINLVVWDFSEVKRSDLWEAHPSSWSKFVLEDSSCWFRSSLLFLKPFVVFPSISFPSSIVSPFS